MFRRSARFLLALTACAAITSLPTGAQALPPTELLGDGSTVIPLKNAAMITRTDVGYRYRAGQQDSHLTITQVGQKLLYVDTGTRELRDHPRSCVEQSQTPGIAVLCTIPAKFTDTNKMFLEIWPRLGDDFIDGSALSTQFRLWALADAGNDTVRGGDGDDFVNGAMGRDQVWGGAGDDWIRTGPDSDVVWGDSGNDRLIAGPQDDDVHGGDGDDRVDGGDNNDTLWSDAGADTVACGSGSDKAFYDVLDHRRYCELEVLTTY
ncbi:MAG TPA: calcium-binding protein [Nocardioides sp.]|nr:calcium-binding protein [Nocardioides sp.]